MSSRQAKRTLINTELTARKKADTVNMLLPLAAGVPGWFYPVSQRRVGFFALERDTLVSRIVTDGHNTRVAAATMAPTVAPPITSPTLWRSSTSRDHAKSGAKNANATAHPGVKLLISTAAKTAKAM